MRDFLKNSYPNEVLDKISDTILATRELSTPKTQLGEIIRDADTYHFGTDEFLLTDKLVKQELEERTKQKYHHWTEHTLRLLQKHKFYTSYCKTRLNGGKGEKYFDARSQKFEINHKKTNSFLVNLNSEEMVSRLRDFKIYRQTPASNADNDIQD